MAFAATAIWEVRTTGSDSNGGGFDATSGTPGTDYSQQDAAQITYSDLVIDGTTNTKATSAGNPFTSAHVGNIINVTGGTGFTVQRVQVMSVSAGAATMDKSLGTLSSTGGAGTLGGALASPGKACGLAVGGNTVYVRGGTVYLITSSTTNSAGGVLQTPGRSGGNVPFRMIGYTTSRGDGGSATFRASGITGTTIISYNTFGNHIENVIVDGNSLTSIRGWDDAGSAGETLINCRALNCKNYGIVAQGVQIMLRGCYATNCTPAGFYLEQNFAYGCLSTSNIGEGFRNGNCIDCISSGNSTYGFNVMSGQRCARVNCDAYNNTSHGFYVQSELAEIWNCIAANNGGYGYNSTVPSALSLFNCAGYSNTSGNVLAGINSTGFLTLSASPFTTPGTDFSLNSTAGGGAACRAAGIPGAFPGGLATGYLDIGAVQSQSLIIVLDD